MRLNQPIESVHNNSIISNNGTLNQNSSHPLVISDLYQPATDPESHPDYNNNINYDTQSNGVTSSTSPTSDMDIHKIITNCSRAVQQQEQQLQHDQQHLNHPHQPQQLPNNGQLVGLGCSPSELIADAALESMEIFSENNSAEGEGSASSALDYMSDAFGELCLSALNCGNSSSSSSLADGSFELDGSGNDAGGSNITKLLLNSGLGIGGVGGNSDDQFLNDCMNHVNNISYLNISCEFELEYATPLFGFCIPFLLFVTVTANLLIVIVLSRRGMATPTNSVLMGMALCDMFTLLCPAPGLIYMLTLGNHNRPLSSVAACHAWIAFYETIPNMFHTASIWLTLALAVQRYIYVCHPPLARTWCTMPRVRKCILGICVAAFLHQSTRFFDRQFTPYSIFWEGEWIEVCRMELTPWVREVVGADLYFLTYFVFRVLFVHLLPCVSLVALNCLLFRAMKQAQDRRENLFRENRKKECKKLRDSNCTTLMLIVVVSVFLVVEIPLAVLTLLHIISSLVVQFLNYHLVSICILFANFALIVSYPINFAIYCGMSRQFRETFKEIFLRGSLTLPNKGSGGGVGGAASRYSLVNGPRTCTNETVL